MVFLSEKEEEFTTMRVKPGNIKRLEKFGCYGDSLDDILSRILDDMETKAKR